MPARRDGRRSKNECPYHEWDELGRPIPPVGYCSLLCYMRPTKGPHKRLTVDKLPAAR